MRHIDLIAARMEEARWHRGVPVAELEVGLGRLFPARDQAPRADRGQYGQGKRICS